MYRQTTGVIVIHIIIITIIVIIIIIIIIIVIYSELVYPACAEFILGNL